FGIIYKNQGVPGAERGAKAPPVKGPTFRSVEIRTGEGGFSPGFMNKKNNDQNRGYCALCALNTGPRSPVDLPDVLAPVFEVLLHLRHELPCIGPVNDAVIEAERQVDHMADGNGVGTVFARDDGRLLEKASYAEDGALRLIDDRCAELLAEDT